MALADRYEGQHAGICGCGAALSWSRDERGEWITTHESQEGAMFCKLTSSDSGIHAIAG